MVIGIKALGGLLAAWFLVAGVTAQAAATKTVPLSIATLSVKPANAGSELRFPLIADPGNAARAINLYLQAVELQQRPDRDAKAKLALPAGSSFAALDYEIAGNTGRVLSLRVHGVRDGVAFSHRHNFDVVSGLPIGLPDLFSPEGYGRLRARAATPRVQRIRDFQQTLDANNEEQSEQRELYEDCLPAVRGDTLTDNQVELAPAHVALERTDCATPDLRALEVLRPLRVEIPLAELPADLQFYGRCALLLPANSALRCELPAKQGLRLGSYAGVIDGKEQINVVIERLYDGDRVDASWSREADGRYHRLQGRVQRDGKAKLFESAPGSEELQVEFTLFGKADGSFDGQWRSISGGAALKSLELKVLRQGLSR